MSERPKFTDYHRQDEQRVKAAIRNPDGQYEHIGREEDPKVAEAMAYAAKPLIDNVLEAANNGVPNNDFLVTAEGHLTGSPTVTYDHTHDFGSGNGYVGKKTATYGELTADVNQAHQAANKVQTEYHDRVNAAQEELKKAKTSI